jgi:D-3-phosphoglycerate dehydrogenase
LLNAIKDAAAIVVVRDRTPFKAELIAKLPKLKLFVFTGSRNTQLDTAAMAARGIPIGHTEMGESKASTAEMTWALILAAMRDLPQNVAALKAGRWQLGVGGTLRGKTLGIYGYGRIGQVVASYGKAFGMRVVVWGREQAHAKAVSDGYVAAKSKQAFFEECDIISLHMRLVDATRGIVSAEDLARMKPTAMLVNTSRAGLVEPGALVAALRAGRPGKAAVDVYEEEPVLGGKHPLLAMDNVICSPHLGYVTREEYELQFSDIFDQIVAFAAGKPINMVNPDALKQR